MHFRSDFIDCLIISERILSLTIKNCLNSHERQERLIAFKLFKYFVKDYNLLYALGITIRKKNKGKNNGIIYTYNFSKSRDNKSVNF